MLEAIRKHSTGIVVKILLVLLVLSFAAWGVGDMFKGGGVSDTVATIGDAKITVQQFGAELNREVDRLRPMFGGNFSLQKARDMGIADNVLNNMIVRKQVALAAADLGLKIDDNVIRSSIRQNPEFFNKVGKFDRFKFEQVLQQNGLTESAYVERVRSGLALAIYLDALRSGVEAPSPLISVLFKYRNERRVLDVARFEDGAQKNIPAPDAATLAAYHKKNAAKYMSPEYRAVGMIVISANDLAGDIAVNEKQIKAAYDSRADEFISPEKRTIQQILFPSEKEAQKARAQIVSGKDFAAVAKAMTGADAKTITLGTFTRSQILPSLATVTFSLKKNTVSQPVKSPLGWHLLRVTAIQPGVQRPLSAVRDKVIADVKHEKALDLMFKVSNKLDDALAGGATLQEAAKDNALTYRAISSIDRRGMDASGKPVANLPQDPKFLKTVFATNQGQDSSLVETKDGYFVVHVQTVTPPALIPLDKVKDRVAADWKAEQQTEIARKKAAALLKKVQSDATNESHFPSMAKAAGASVVTSPAIRRDGDGDTLNLPKKLLAEVFKDKQGGLAMASAPGVSLVARVRTVEPADPALAGVMDAEIKKKLAANMAGDLLEQIAAAMHVRYPSTIDRAAFDRVF
ncbi:SurA N-terminal domain-containing protein [Varunaivibrio sulfuroxidans]|uniref:Parvulin-like PPIase n=1 Tax=Varunaivibrio sulfuroxidans TaxID=1773489 RepID=A0A4R3JHD1_9PROT|nr:SurA N-terminal domain-containing protein [Varunaivibrio sulfuroxidans]TCS64190.1 peptidyl-prolyl cis-trans isomerase D [Varunaivibrio sulfuroxidans]WES31365.1 SurA N-terminal domain-containing protein [Varunaivibrio sulfuroxidans]